jgi:hypothetical protein
MGDIKTQIGHGFLDQSSRLEDFALVIEQAGEVDGSQLHHVRQRGAGLATVIVLLLDQNLGTGAIDRGAIAKVHVGAADANNDTRNKPGPVGQILEKDFVEIEFLFGLVLA